MTRRDFAALPLLALPLAAQEIASPTRRSWYSKIRRAGQLNFNERDPETLDIKAWLDYWEELRVEVLIVNAGGIVAFYPTEIPFHRRSRFLGHRDLFGEYAREAKRRGIRVIARLDPNWNYEDAVKAKPEWFERENDGSPRRHNEAAGLFKTCAFSSYFNEQIPDIIREVNARYPVDGFFTNGWPGPGKRPECACESCRKRSGEDAHLERILEIWQLWDETTKAHSQDSLFIGNLGGGIRAVPNLKRIGGVAGWFNGDHQGYRESGPVWSCAQQIRVAQSVMKGKLVTNVTGSYGTTRPVWRHTAKSAAEMRMWLAQTTAGGAVPWLHWLGGSPEDQRWRAPGREFFQWIAKHEAHFINRGPVSNLGVVFSQRSIQRSGAESLEGLYAALLEGRQVFSLVHEDDLGAESLRRYSALVLPNLSELSPKQVSQLKAYSDGGGSLVASFESGRSLAPLFGCEIAGEVQGGANIGSYLHIETPHPIWSGFRDTALLTGPEYRLPVRAAGKAPLTVVPQYPAFPPEMVYPEQARTTEPGIVLSERNGSRLVYFPGDIERSYWKASHPDLASLLNAAIRWALHDRSPVRVEGAGLAELFAWETEPGWAVHILNYNNPYAMKGWFREPAPLGPQRISLALPEGSKVRRVLALSNEAELKHSVESGVLRCEVPSVTDYEVVAVIRD